MERLFEHCGCQVPDFQSDEDAANQLGLLLRQIGRSSMLLVVDDVWPGSEKQYVCIMHIMLFNFHINSRLCDPPSVYFLIS